MRFPASSRRSLEVEARDDRGRALARSSAPNGQRCELHVLPGAYTFAVLEDKRKLVERAL